MEHGSDSERPPAHAGEVVRCDPADPDTVVDAVVEAVARASGTEPLALSPLVGVVDPDALGAVLRVATSDSTISFRYHGHDVTVRGDGRVAASDPGA
ncbi:HalOD1 output domain-containing protein [Halobaculum litoreum]|uniref:HalOD1 output domain-containing protein n=1 Tax=Halobaculum litoreum TaxID=3031998 RepID=UPI0024C3A2A1|nr:HalOD1 output domain-containing protein [Halobaculum sp. DT92]